MRSAAYCSTVSTSSPATGTGPMRGIRWLLMIVVYPSVVLFLRRLVCG